VDSFGRTRREWKRLLVCAVVGLPLVAAAVAAWQLEHLRSQAPAKVAAALGAMFGAQASVHEVSLDLAHAGLVVRGVEVRSGSRTLLQASELVGRPALAALLRGRLELQSLSIPTARVRLHAEDLRRIALAGGDELVALLSVADLQLSIESAGYGTVELEHAALTLPASHGNATVQLASSHAVWTSAAGRVLAHSPVELRGGWTRSGAGQSGPVAAAAAMSGKGQLRLDALELDHSAGAAPVVLNWRVAGERWELQTQLKFGDATLAAHAKLSPDAVTLELRPRGVSIESLFELAGKTDPTLHGQLDGDLQLTGALSPLSLSGSYQLTARNLRVAGGPGASNAILAIPQLAAAGDARIDMASLRLDGLRLRLPHSQLTGSVAASALGELTADLHSEALDLADLGSIWGLSIAGRGAFDASAQLGRAAPSVRAKLALTGAAIGGKSLGALDAELTLDPTTGRLSVERGQANSPERHVVADGSVVELTAAGLTRAEAKLRLVRLPLRELYRLLGAADDPVLSRLQGSAAGAADLSYRSAGDAQTAALDLGLTLQLTEIDLAGYPFDRGKLSARIVIPDRSRGLAAGTLTLGQLMLTAASGTLDLSGEIRRSKLDMQLAVRALPLERSPWLRTRSQSLLTGLIEGRGTLSGDAVSTRADLQLGLDGLRLLGEPLGRIQLKALLRGPAGDAGSATECRESRAALASGAFRDSNAWLFCGSGLDSHLDVDLALGNSAARPIRGRVALADFALGPFVRGLQPSAAGAADPSKLSATLELTGGGLADPERVSGALRVQKLALGSGDARLESSAPFELRVRDGALELTGGKLTGPIQHFTLAATGTLGKAGRITADGEVAASAFTRDSEPLVKAFGNVGVHLELTPGAQPALRGRAELQDLAVRGPGSLQARRMRGALLLAGDRLRLEGVEADFGDGKVQVAGEMQLAGLRVAAYDLAIDAQKVALEPEPLVQVELDAATKLRWRGAPALPDLSGNITVRRLAYGKPLHLEALAAMNRERPGPPPRDRLNLDLTVDQREPMRVRNTLLDGELAIAGPDHKLRVVGTDQRLGLLGALAVTRGRLLFQGDQFHFTRGDIALNDPARIAPRFDVRAVADQPKRKDTAVVLSAQGTREAFKVAIQCDAGAAAVDAPPFTCNYAHDRMACDDFERLVAQWTCPTKQAKASAGTSRR
jgi:hypothetical protein